MESNNKIIDEAYEKLLSTSEAVSTNGITEEFIDKMSEIKDDIDIINESFNDQDVDEEVANIEIPENASHMNSEKVMAKYNPSNSNTIIGCTGMGKENSCKVSKIIDNNFNNLVGTDKESIESSIQAVDDQISNEDAAAIATLISKRIAGETTGFYEGLPANMKKMVNEIIMNSNTSNIKNSQIKNKNVVARSIIDELIGDMRKTPEAGFDIDTMLSKFDEDVEKLRNEMSSEIGDMMMSFDDERKAALDAAIKRCNETKNEEGAKKLEIMKKSIDDAYNLKDFAEFCKTCKIKNFEIIKPSRLFTPFNAKYESHKYVINDIQTCPDILSWHLNNNTTVQNLMLCIAFCKYTRDMSPDNIAEHTFMYYFIRNIITIDRMNPKANFYNSLDDKCQKFYDGFKENLYHCTEKLLERNPTFI